MLLLFATNQKTLAQGDLNIQGKMSSSVDDQYFHFNWWGFARYDTDGKVWCDNVDSENSHILKTWSGTSPGWAGFDSGSLSSASAGAGNGAIQLGPSMPYTIVFKYETGSNSTGCNLHWGYSSFSGTTAKIKAPVNLLASFQTSPNYSVKLTWNKGTSIDNNNIQYLIKRNGTEIARASGGSVEFVDTGILPGMGYSYTVQTIVGPNAPGDWIRDVSDAVSTTISSQSFQLTATQTDVGRIKLTWPTLSSIKGLERIAIFRDGEVITELTKTTKTYNDPDVMPGMYYSYRLGLIEDEDPNTPAIDVNNWTSNIAKGRSLPKGKISGYVKGKTNGGVPGVEITVTSKTNLSDKETAQTYSYTTTSGADGYYEISNIFFAASAEYIVKPKMPGYDKPRFDPDSLIRKLDIDNFNQSQVNFSDTASFAISGKVYFSSLIDSNGVSIKLPLKDAEIWVDGKNTQTKTSPDGSYSTTIINGGVYTVEAKFKNHTIKAVGEIVSSKRVSVYSLVNGVDFEDLTTDTLNIHVAASCDAFIGEYALVKLTSAVAGVTPTGDKLIYGKPIKISSKAFSRGTTFGQKEPGITSLILPATQFNVQVVEVRELNGINSNKLEYFTREYNVQSADLGKRDTIDGKAVIRQADFIYHKDLEVLLNNGNDIFSEKKKFRPTGQDKFLVAQNDKYPVNIKIRETYEYDGVQYNCALDTGTVYIYDAISDSTDRQELKMDSGFVKYFVKVGQPVLEAPYEKSIQFVGKVGGRQTSVIVKAVVEGERPRRETFVTKTPEIPFFVLHDPPGDKSFSKISKGTTISTTSTTQYGGGAGGGAYADVKTGKGVVLPIIGKIGAAIQIQSEVEAGADKNSGTTTNRTITFTEDFSTSGEETLVGNEGDLYVGASLNMTYALTDKLYYNESKQDMDRDTSLAVNNDGFNTTFLYTEKHIKNTLLAQLSTLYSISKSDYDVAYQKVKSGDNSISNEVLEKMNQQQLEYKANIDAWKSALVKNEANRKNAKDRKLPDGVKGVVGGNISFSSGAIYDNTISIDADTTTFDEVSVYLNGYVKVGISMHGGEANETNAGGLVTFRFNHSKNKENSTTTSTTTSYHLEDNDIGDFFSVGLAEDQVYGTPVFKTVSGSSSCPHENNTQFRHLPAMQIAGVSEQRNVPSDKPAKFEILISNRSESDETVEYAIKLDPLSNLDGAKVLVGGQDVTNKAATYYIPTGKSFKLPVEVYRGPLTSTYENLTLVIFSTCDNTLDDISEFDTLAKPKVKFNAYFQNRCSDVDLFVPGDNWVVNQSNNNQLFVAFSKYDASESSPLTTVGLQYRKINTDYENGLWQTVITVPKANLKDKYYDYTFDVSGLPDGNYELRAIAICQGVDVNYSPVYKGKIDRKSAVAFGVPSPKNGILTVADIIGITFNKDIVYADISNPVKVTLKRKDNGQLIPATFLSDGKNFEIRTIPANAINDYENVELIATIKNLTDVIGNKVADSISWSFVVNLSPVYWSPANITINAIENQQTSFGAKLINKSGTPQNFSLIKYPEWLRPTIKSSKIVAQGQENIDFELNKNLNTGTYADTVIALIDGKRQFLYVKVNVSKTPPVWTVNPSAFKYNMAVTAQFSLNQTDTLTSKDIRDKIGVFVGNECRGIAPIEYDSDANKYIAYITAYSNTAGEELTIRFWDAYPGVEYQGKELLSFVANGTIGNLTNPIILHPEGVIQTIPLKKGWTWISLNVENSDMSLKKILSSLKPTEGDIIKTLSNNNTYSQYSSKLGWVGTFDKINLYNSYMIYVAKPDTLRVLGNFMTQPANVVLNKGWNWTGYPMAINMELGTYLKNFNPSDGLKVVSQEEFAQYNAVTKTWSGSLKYLRPGKGYKIYSGTDTFTIPVIPYAPNPGEDQGNIQTAPVYNPAAPTIINNNNTTVTSTVYQNTSVNTVNYENNMSVTSVINQGGQIINNTNNRYETYVYVENKLVNIVNQVVLPDGKSVGFIPVNGDKTDDGKTVEIKVYDKVEKKEYTAKVEEPLKQQGDQITGNIDHPVILVLEGNADLKVENIVESSEVNKGENFNYIIRIKNVGKDLAVNAILKDTLDASINYISSSFANTSFNDVENVMEIQLAKLEAEAEQEIILVLKANKIGDTYLGKGNIVVNNDVNLSNNSLKPQSLRVIDNRSNSAKLLIPSLFTPNGDGINDLFEIVGVNEFYASNTLIIFNKAYNQIFKKDNYQNDWTGDNLPMGSYGYILKVKGKDGVEQVFKGYITIVY
ncbi:T9SS type B sorting domain-containing protein [Solitalea canadensis]|nr:gliding motility-associated C-terminal domain-containing protein [Solitalea canadensis]